MIENWSEAMQQKNAENVISYYAPNSVQFLLAPPLQLAGAKSPAKEGIQEWFSSWDGPIGFEVRDLTIWSSGDVAFACCLSRMLGKRTSGEQTDVWYRVTLGFRKINGKWLIQHEHESVPFYMDGSLRAAVDLKPNG